MPLMCGVRLSFNLFLFLEIEALNKPRIEMTAPEFVIPHEFPVKGNCCLDPLNDKLVESVVHFFNRLFAGPAFDDEFCNHGVIVGGIS